MTDNLEQLKEIARERWGERWTITQKHFADGTVKSIAWRSYGPADTDKDDDGTVVECERIRLDDDRDEVLHDHVDRRSGEVVETHDVEVCAPDELSDFDTLERTKK